MFLIQECLDSISEHKLHQMEDPKLLESSVWQWNPSSTLLITMIPGNKKLYKITYMHKTHVMEVIFSSTLNLQMYNHYIKRRSRPEQIVVTVAFEHSF